NKSGGMPNKESINTNFGALDPEKTGFAVKQIHDEQIGSIYRNLSDVLIGKFPGVKVIGTAGEARVALRSNELLDIYAAWDVDGILYPADQPPLHIDVDNVKSITIMPGGWAAARYGALAGGGVIIVKTIGQSFENGERNLGKPFDQALLRDNLYGNDAMDIANLKRVEPKYIQLIREQEDFRNAYDRYLEQRQLFGHSSRFFSDVHDIFRDVFSQKNASIKVLSNIKELFRTDVATLKFLAYKLEEEGELELAKTVYEEILSIDENKAQSRRDLANINVKLGNIGDAWTIYRDYLLTRDGTLSDSGLDKIVKSEAIELIRNNPDSISSFTNSIPKALSQSEVSILFEWNDPSAEFELQFVNPQNRYFVWKHTEETQSLINDEILKGYFSNIFEIETKRNGKWLVNVKYLGNQSNSSSYLKMTIRNNKSRTERVKLIELKNKNINYSIMRL
ncbi:MAG: TonB-dependent receptor plug domain-containing protein, partial [Bacteroidota bacterium]